MPTSFLPEINVSRACMEHKERQTSWSEYVFTYKGQRPLLHPELPRRIIGWHIGKASHVQIQRDPRRRRQTHMQILVVNQLGFIVAAAPERYIYELVFAHTASLRQHIPGLSCAHVDQL